MVLNKTRQIIASVAVAAVLALSLITVVATYFPAQQTNQKNPAATESTSSLTSNTASMSSTASETMVATKGSSIESTQQGTTTSFLIMTTCVGNCTLNLPWPRYQTLRALRGASELVVIANITSASIVTVEGIPVTHYNISVARALYGYDSSGYRTTNVTGIPPGSVLSVSQLGGITNGSSMNVKGYPQLTRGGTYLFFLSLAGSFLQPYYGTSYISVGGPQGTFIVQGGKVFSLDNVYPQDDSWLPVKAEGVPLAQFIASTAESTTVVSSTATTELGTSTSWSFNADACGNNCTVNYLPWSTYSTLQELKNASYLVALANASSALTIKVHGVPVTYYNITIDSTLYGYKGAYFPPGSVVTVSQIGGTANGTTMYLRGYPQLTKGATYLFFLSNPTYLAYLYGQPSQDIPKNTYTTAGGPQGLFYVQEGKIFSLDNMFPQDDAWMPVKIAGVPLDQIILEVESSSSSSSTQPTTSSSSQPTPSTITSSTISTVSSSQSTSTRAGTPTGVGFIYAGTAAIAIIIVIAATAAYLRKRGRHQLVP